MPLTFHERHDGLETTILEFSGRLELGRDNDAIEGLVDDLVKRPTLRVIFDLTEVDYIDSAGLGMLALSSGSLKAAGGKLAVVAGPGRVLDMLKLTQVISVVTVRGSIEEAEIAMGQVGA